MATLVQSEIIIDGWPYALAQLIDGESEDKPYLRYEGTLYVPHDELVEERRARHAEQRAARLNAVLEYARGERETRERIDPEEIRLQHQDDLARLADEVLRQTKYADQCKRERDEALARLAELEAKQ